MKCLTCDGYGYLDGAPDTPNQGRCPDCYCEWCLECSGKINAKDADGYPICGKCLDYYRTKYV